MSNRKPQIPGTIPFCFLLLCLTLTPEINVSAEVIFEDGFETAPVQVVNQASGSFEFTCAEFPSLLTGAAPPALTIELWFKRVGGSIGLGTILERHDGSVGLRDFGGIGFGLIQAGSTDEIWWFEGDWRAPVFLGLVTGTWHHLVIQRAGGSLFVWLNGNFEDEYVLPADLGPNFPSGISTHIGCDGDESSGNWADEFRGSLDELRISTIERFEPYTNFDPPCGYVTDIETHALYKMEGASTDVIEDSGENGHDGIMIQGATSTDVPSSECL
jgi:hypothetical protein